MMTNTPVNSVESASATEVKQAEEIRPVNKNEAAQLATFELEQVLTLVEQLEGDDWTQPTDCSEWNVRDMTAHLAGACAGYASWPEFRRQAVFNPHLLKTIVSVDGVNIRQLEDRVDKSPQELIAELQKVGPKAVNTRRSVPNLVRKINIPAQPMSGFMSIGYLLDVIYPRDQWMHRMDICRATGKPLVITPGHDHRLLDLVMRDVARTLGGNLAIQVNITGALTAGYRFGEATPAAEIDIDYLTFNRRASMRINADEALKSTIIRGEETIARQFLQDCPVLY